ncbi:MAG: hypothetical protein M1827_002557 [Pycnora praestabilis]|nr:MAG: hypothetical protein M1827_002557 [Pycnora praestabilis]
MLSIITTSVAMLLFTLGGVAQTTYTETIYGAVIFTRYGERSPLILSEPNVLTPVGAQQLYSAGTFFRNRYLTPPANANDGSVMTNSSVLGISTHNIDNSQIYAMSLVDEYITGSAQAFMQGLYPPVDMILTSDNHLANGSIIDYPLSGYQYPQIQTVGDLDPNIVFIAGEVNCPQYTQSGDEYPNTPEFSAIQASSKALYSSLEPKILNGIIPDTAVGYDNAYDIFDYVNYQSSYNKTISESISSSDLATLRILADQHEWAINANLSASGNTPGDSIRAITGQTFAGSVLEILLNNIENNGDVDKLSLVFGSYEPFLAFFSLAQLPQVDSDFYGLPDYGSAMVFELFSTGINGTSTTYPDSQDLKVRFLFRNGTDQNTELVSYPLFGRGRSETDMSLTDFINGMETIMLPDVGDWCNTCDSLSSFCAAYSNSTCSSDSSPNSGSKMSPAVAGVVGAVATLGVIGLLVAAAMLLGGIRFHRSAAKRRSALGGFKGAEKLASDTDLARGSGTAVADKGSERVGSWELRDNGKVSEERTEHMPERMPEHMSRPVSSAVSSLKGDDEIGVDPWGEPVKIDDHV